MDVRYFGLYDIPIKLVEEYTQLSLIELITLYSESVRFELDDPGVASPYVDPACTDAGKAKKHLKFIPLFLFNMLRLVRSQDVQELVEDIHVDLSKRIEELERRSKTHRHKTIMGLYTERPSFN